MNLNRETYEAWLLDRLEGRLSPAQEQELDAFLHSNPDLRMDSGELPHVKDDGGEFPAKDPLRKSYPPTGTIDANKLDDFLVARLEKDLGPAQEKQLERYLYEHPGSERQAALMALTKVPNDAVLFAEKECMEHHFPPKGMPDAYHLTDFLIADLEGDLSPEQEHALKQFIAGNNEAERQQKLVAATHVVPEAVAYTGKAGLKKQEPRVVALWPRLAAAASILLLLGTGWWLLRERPPGRTGIAGTVQPATPVIASVATTAEPAAPANPAEVITVNALPRTISRQAPVAATSTAPILPRMAEIRTQQTMPVHFLSTTTPHLRRGTLPRPALAVVEQAPQLANMPNTAPEQGARLAARPGSTADQELGTLLANKLRNTMLSEPERPAPLDQADALAMAGKAVMALTGGRGGLEVQRGHSQRRVRLHLGRDISLSANVGR